IEANLDPGLKAENPLDAWGSHNRFEARFEACLNALMQDPNVAAGAFFSNYRDGYFLSEAIYRVVEAVSKKTDKPIALATCYSDLANSAICRAAHAAGIPLIDGAHETLLAFRHLFDYRKFKQQEAALAASVELNRDKVTSWKQKLAEHASETLGETDALALLSDFGLAVVSHATVTRESELLTAAAKIGYPLVLKTAQPGIDHKSDSNGVFVNIASDTELLEKYSDLNARLGPTALVSRMIEQGIEIALGTVNDDQFGPIVMIAAGGILVELLADKAVAMCPASQAQAAEMIDSLKANRLLQGMRGQPAANRQALIDAVVSLSIIAFEFKDSIAEIDINPVLVNQDGALAVDALILRKKSEATC
ncbi:MAG: acetate--CoA ligase family protein, partial [Gammaproteobacteria bacterium]|nr:acetate--CoA ligase family protein [Gammaproteobacteria bacterium]